MAKSEFVYITFIRTTPEALWNALTDLEFARQYWMGMTQETDWKAGSPWRLSKADGALAASGTIVESEPPRRLAVEWQDELRPEFKAEGHSLLVMELEPVKGSVKLTLTQSIARPDSKLIGAVSGG